MNVIIFYKNYSIDVTESSFLKWNINRKYNKIFQHLIITRYFQQIEVIIRVMIYNKCY